MSGNWLGLVELSLALLSALGWAVYELYALRVKPPADSSADQPGADKTAGPPADSTTDSAAPPRHPERQ